MNLARRKKNRTDEEKRLGLHKKPHLDPFFGLGTGQRTALIASSKTVFKPFWVRALHSRYLTAPTSFAIARPYIVQDSGKILEEMYFKKYISYLRISDWR